MLGLARHLPADTRSTFMTFAEGGRCQALLDQARAQGFDAIELAHNAPHVRVAAKEVAQHLRRLGADLVTCSGYKPDIVGWMAARQLGIPVLAVAHGWTAATLKVRFYETIDRLVLRFMDAVVCVSEAQADKVRRAWVPENKIAVIRNAIGAEAFLPPNPAYGDLLRHFFVAPPRYVVGAAGRLSREKGFDQLVEAAALVVERRPDVGFVHFGDGPLRQDITRQIAKLDLRERFVLAGFRSDLGAFLPHLDVLALPSFTEGLPVVLLEGLAAGVPAVATAVGGTPEALQDGRCGYLVAPGDPEAMAQRILDLLSDDERRKSMGELGRRRVQDEFAFTAQAAQYQLLFDKLIAKRRRIYVS
ncbi:MAG: glycosyltransferase [Gemmataceae bacterium]|nr:glycosyltransferase [Gemmataceae bacterium]MCI0740736.1 glycosyltransferase [Gemmataceae bacterium]